MTKQKIITNSYILDEGDIEGVSESAAIVKLGNAILGLEDTMKLRENYTSMCFSHIILAVREKLLPQGYDGAIVNFRNYQYDFKFDTTVT